MTNAVKHFKFEELVVSAEFIHGVLEHRGKFFDHPNSAQSDGDGTSLGDSPGAGRRNAAP